MIKYSEKKALVIDDFTEFAHSIKATLGQIGVKHIDIVGNGEAAIDHCNTHLYDIILSDFNLGKGKDGLQVLEEIHHKNRIKSDTAYIMLTAESTPAMVLGALEYQPDGYLTKPFNTAVLRSRLDKILEKKETLLPIYAAAEKNQWEDAIALCDKIMKEFPKYKMACLRLKGDYYTQKKDWSKAMNVFNSVLEKRTLPWATFGLAKVMLEQKKYDSAYSILAEAIKQYPMSLEGYDLLADCQIKLNQEQEAQATLQEAVNKSPRVVKRQAKLGDVATENKNFNISGKAFRQAIFFGRHSIYKSANHYIQLIKSAYQQIKFGQVTEKKKTNLVKDTGKFIDEFKQNYEMDNKSLLRGSVAEACFYKVQNKEFESKRCLEKSKKLYNSIDSMLPAYEGLEVAQGFDELGEEEISQEILNDVIQQNFEDAKFVNSAKTLLKDKSIIDRAKTSNALNEEGIRYFEQQQFSKAIESFSKAVKLSPQNINITLNTVQALIKMYQSVEQRKLFIEQASSFLGNLKKLHPDDKRYKRYNELLRLTNILKTNEINS